MSYQSVAVFSMGYVSSSVTANKKVSLGLGIKGTSFKVEDDVEGVFIEVFCDFRMDI